MIDSSMSVPKEQPYNHSEEQQLRDKLFLLIQELEKLREIAEEKLYQLESNIEVKISDLENKLLILEERLTIINLVILSLEPSKRVN